MAAAESWQKAEIAGPKKALVISKPEVIVAMLKRAKRPILIVGHEVAQISLGKKNLIRYIINLAETAQAPVLATAHVIGEFLDQGFHAATCMPVVDIAQRLQDQEWKGLDGKGQYDLALFMGIPYYMEWLILSSLKHFSPNLKTICLDRFYQPHATWSFPNISIKDWSNQLTITLDKLGEK